MKWQLKIGFRLILCFTGVLGAYLLLALAIDSNRDDIGCHKTKTSFTFVILSPLRIATSKFLRSKLRRHIHDLQRSTGFPPGFDINISAWPNWAARTANHTVVNIEGSVMAVSTTDELQFFSFDLANRLGFMTGQPILPGMDPCTAKSHDPRFDYRFALNVAIDFFSRALSGASLAVGDVEFRTNQLGHFEGLMTLPASANLSNTAVNEYELVLKDCPKMRSRQNQTIRTNKVFQLGQNGVVVVSDIDDVLRVATTWDFNTCLQELFVKPWRNWLNIHHVFHRWHDQVADLHFHYATDAPEMIHKFYVEGVKQFFPEGSFSFRPMLFQSLSQLLNPRYVNLNRLLRNVPQRKFVLVGDTTTASTITAYSRLAKEYPGQIECILMRDVAATEPSNWIVPNLGVLPRNITMLFKVPDDLDGFEAQLQQLADGVARGCGRLFNTLAVSHAGHTSSRSGAWLKTVWGGLTAYTECMWTSDRPSPKFCRLDRPTRNAKEGGE